MAEEKKPEEEEKKEDGEAEEEKPKKKISPMMIIIPVVALVVLVAAAGIAYFMTTTVMKSSMSDDGGGGGPSRFHDPGVFVKLGDPKEGILVNVGGIKAGHFLKIGLMIEMNPGKKDIINKEGKIEPVAETKLMDTVLHILRSEPLEGYDASKQDALKEKIRNEVNRELGEGSVYGVYITSFVLQ